MISQLGFVLIIVLTLALGFWKNIIKKQKVKWSNILMFLVFPIMQLVMVAIMDSMDISDYERLNVSRFIFIVVSLVADVIVMYLVFTRNSKEVLIAELREAEYALERDKADKVLRADMEVEIKKMKDSFAEWVNAISDELKQGDVDKSKAILEQANDNVSMIKTKEFCENPVVNAVLSEKLRECMKHGIEMNIDMQYRGDMGLTGVETCSLYSNLLDNAIRAALVSDCDVKSISLQTGKVGDYLTIRVENTADIRSQKKDNSRKHYGKEIIEEIVRRYGGEYSGTWDKKANRYEANAIILLKGAW